MNQLADLAYVQKARTVFPGVLMSLTVAFAAKFISEHYGAPVMLIALLIGMAFNFLVEDGGVCVSGIEFSSKVVLRFGVALLGLGITVQQIASTGSEVLLITLCGVALTITMGLALSRFLGRGTRFGLLIGGAVAICGASAALAISSVLPKGESLERDTIFTVIGVTALSTLAMIVYPIIANAMDLSEIATGVFFGATIHDVAQVVGAGYSVSDVAKRNCYLRQVAARRAAGADRGRAVTGVFGIPRTRRETLASDPVLRHRFCSPGDRLALMTSSRSSSRTGCCRSRAGVWWWLLRRSA